MTESFKSGVCRRCFNKRAVCERHELCSYCCAIITGCPKSPVSEAWIEAQHNHVHTALAHRADLAQDSLKAKLEKAESLQNQVKTLHDMLAEAYKKIDKLETIVHRIKAIIP